MDLKTQNPNQLFDYDVVDTNGNKIGSVDGVWVDDATSELEFLGVKTGWIFGKTHIIPAANASISDGTVQVPFDTQMVKDSPSFSTDAELTPDDEQQVYSYYGIDRTTSTSPTGLPANQGTASYGTQTTDTGTGNYAATSNYGTDTTQTDIGQGEREIDVPLSEEKLDIGKRREQAGNVHLRKVVREEDVSQPVELQREEVEVERVPADRATSEVPSDAFQEKDIDVPVTREEAVVGKETRVTGEARVRKDIETETRNVGGTVRREDVEVDKDYENETDLPSSDASDY
jgi:uncharacterized protein (TIGR02271 family)